MDVVQLSDPDEFLDRAARLLLADEARHNLILGLAGTLRDQPGLYPEHELWVVEHDGEVVCAALRTPPLRLVLAQPTVTGAVEALALALAELPGVVGAVPEAMEFARAWKDRTGAILDARTQVIYRLERVVTPRPTPGASRAAEEHERDLLLDWLFAFAVEALGEEEPDRTRHQRIVDQRLGSFSETGFVFWEDGGRPVSLAGFSGSTPNGARIGPVYTPPELRGRGYASALVADVSQARLDAGKRSCFLYTDRMNPTSNKIYVDIGYERVCDSIEIDFV
jgi:predicted GNAT family acetyltransferase